ncbi:MAG: L-serine ammonia-lyase, iron-sulfur-dependent, subunit alpha [Elusimicrobiota bacterium]
MNDKKIKNIEGLMDREIKEVVGCTEPASIAYAFSTALLELEKQTGEEFGPEDLKVNLKLSKDVFRNVSTVKIPIIKKKGPKAATASGLVLKGDSLNMFKDFDRETQNKVTELVDKNRWYTGYPVDRRGIYVEAKVSSGSDEVKVVIESEHDLIKSISYNGKRVFFEDNNKNKREPTFNSLRDIMEIVEDKPPVLIDKVKNFINKQGKNVKKYGYKNYLPGVKDLTLKRMEGEPVKIMTITGSGNQGIFLGVPLYLVYREYGKEFLPAALFTVLTQFHLAAEKGRISSTCGLADKAALSLAAGFSYFKDENLNNVENNLKLTEETLKGLKCEGAKLSCSYKAAIAIKAVREIIKDN